VSWYAASFAAVWCASAFGQSAIIEPDDYADETILTQINPYVTMSSTNSDNVPVAVWPVTAYTDGFGYAPTGTRVFSHANVPFWNNVRRLRLDFAAPASRVRIDFAGGDFFHPETGRIEAYNAANQPVGLYQSAPLGAGQVDTLDIVRDEGDIAWAVAYVPPDQGNFGRLDRLEFTIASSVRGDLDGDGDVDISDLTLLISAFGSCASDANFDPDADFNADGCIGLADLTILLSNFGR
jgi:hypothetical protein